MFQSYFNNNPLLSDNEKLIKSDIFLPKLVPPFPFQPPDPYKYQSLPLEKRSKKLEDLAQQEKLLNVLREQTELMEKLLFKYKRKDDERMQIYDKRLEKFAGKSEKVKEIKLNYGYISEKIDQSLLVFIEVFLFIYFLSFCLLEFKQVLEVGIDSNPFYPL